MIKREVLTVSVSEAVNLSYLLALFNSNVSIKLLKIINHTANNSSNYLKKIPIFINDSLITDANTIIHEYFENNNLINTLDEINILFDKVYSKVL